MEKDFDTWNEIKKNIEQSKRNILFTAGEVWWCTVGLNIAEESCGKGETFRRPVVILKKLSRSNFIGIPLSTKKKDGTWFTSISIRKVLQYALLYQVRMLSTHRLQRRLTTLDRVDFIRIKEKLAALLELSYNHQNVNPGSVGNPKSNNSIE